MKVTRIIALIVVLLAVSSTAQAQHRKKSNNSRQFDFELRGGLNFCQIDGDGSGSYDKLGFHGGVNTSFPISDNEHLRFVVELGVTQKGSHILTNAMDRTISLLYVEVPLMIAYDMLYKQQLRVGVGLAPAILAKANVTTDGSYDQLQSENYKRFDAIPVCVSLRYRITDHIGADVRYYNSMLNTAKENGTGTYRIVRSNKGQFNRLLQAGLTINF